MSEYMKGYRDGFELARLKDAEQVYQSQCDEIERRLAQLAAAIYRRRPEQCRRETREYIAQSQYFAGLCEGYAHGRRAESARDR